MQSMSSKTEITRVKQNISKMPLHVILKQPAVKIMITK